MIGRTEFTIEPGKPWLVIRRVFDAPPHLVFEATTRPEHMKHWYGPRGSRVTDCRIDLRPGGHWRVVVLMPDGSEHGFGGVYREVEPGNRLVYTFVYDGFPDAEAVESVTFEAQPGDRTLVTIHVMHKSVEHRDGHVASGMEVGATESQDRLAERLAALAQNPS